MTEHIAPASALALAALPEDDPEGRQARAHAAECPACRALLDESAEILRLIDADHSCPSVDPRLKARVKAALFAEPRPRARWERLALALCASASLALVLFDGQLDRPLVARVGVHCLLYEAAFGLLPSAALFLSVRGMRAGDGMRLGALGAALALIGQLLLRTRCPVHDAGLHLLTFHFGGVLLVAWLAASLARLARLVPR